MKSQIVTSSWGGVRKAPFAFTDYGVAMLSSVLKSSRAIQVNIQIMRAFATMRKLMMTDGALKKIIEEHEKRLDTHDNLIQQAFDVVKRVLEPDTAPLPVKSEYVPDESKKAGFTKR